MIIIAGGELVTNNHKSYSSNYQRRSIAFRKKNFEKIIGVKIGIEDVKRILINLGCNIIEKDNSLLCNPLV